LVVDRLRLWWMESGEAALPSDDELRACAAVLRRLLPSQLPPVGAEPPSEALGELLSSGLNLFRSRALEERFGQQDAVEYFKEKHNHEKRLKKLQKLEEQIKKLHDTRVEEVSSRGINVERDERTLANAAGGDKNLHHVITAAEWQASRFVPRWAPRGPGDGTQGRGGLAVPPNSYRGVWREHDVSDEEDANEQEGDVKTDVSKTVDTSEIGKEASEIPAFDFRRRCMVCKQNFTELHHFYHQLCRECGDYNYTKRQQTGNLAGFVCIVTGGRVRIGYQIVLKLLRGGAQVVSTSRYPYDAAMRFSQEPDFEDWKDRLEFVGLELADLRSVEAFCQFVAERYQRIHVLINNAAQTLTRPPDWLQRMDALENKAAREMPRAARALLSGAEERLALCPPDDPLESVEQVVHSNAQDPATSSSTNERAATSSESTPVVQIGKAEIEAKAVAVIARPGSNQQVLQEWGMREMVLKIKDESAQPLDLSRQNSWSRRLGDVPTVELLQTLACNAAAPFVLCGKFRPLLSPDKSDPDAPWGHIINVSALEGQFSVGRKPSGHPHTNMGKAALNMLTATSAADLFKDRVLCNAVDTGWVTDMAPGQKGFMKATHKTHVGTPLDEDDGASRVLDPVFLHLNTGFKEYGLFWKHYRCASW